ncbi:MAG TPA: hypothetical protein VEB64_15375 [Azospirillaceae bacterium]|nr:hypothetical protein [Azospirillaceae bacterium]
MTAQIIDLQARRTDIVRRQQREREERFDRELRRRLTAFLEGEELPVEPIPDNPYL